MVVLLAFTGMLVVAIAVEPMAARLRLPFGAALVVTGFAVSEALVAFGVDTGLRWYHFTELILDVFLPVLVFQAAFSLNVGTIFRRLAPILYLAVPLFVLGSVMTGGLVYLGVGHPEGFPWPVALLTGVLISASDPAAVVGTFERLGAPVRLRLVLEGEGLFNDATAIVLFGLVLSLALGETAPFQVEHALTEFFRVFLGGIVAGTIVGIIATGLMFTFRGPIPCTIISTAAVLLSLFLAGRMFHASGIMAVLAAGLVMGETNRRFCHEDFVSEFWALAGYVASALVFLLMGATITVGMFSSHWLAMLIGIGAALLTRTVLIYGLMPPLSWLVRGPRVPAREGAVMCWGGLRGAVTLALALSLPLELEGWYTAQSIAYGVVLFSLFVQAPGMDPLLRRLGLTGQPSD